MKLNQKPVTRRVVLSGMAGTAVSVWAAGMAFAKPPNRTGVYSNTYNNTYGV